jgi:hypothetical protein
LSAQRGRARTVLASLVATVALVAGCSEPNRADDDRDREGTTDDSSASTTTEENADRREVVEAFGAAGDAFDEAAGGPDPAYPLDETHTGPMLEQARVIVEGLAADGLVLEYPPDSRLRESVTSVEFRGDDVAILEVCTVDDGRRVRQDTGEVVAGGGISTVWADVAMERHDGTWKLAERRETDRRDGEGACDGDG